MRKALLLILIVIFSATGLTGVQAATYFEARWSDTGQPVGVRVFKKSVYWDSVKNKPKALPAIQVTIDLAVYSTGTLQHQVAGTDDWQTNSEIDLGKLAAVKGPVSTTISFPEWIDCGGGKPTFCSGEWLERIVLLDAQGQLIDGQDMDINRYVDPPAFNLSVTGKISAKLGTFYSATVKLTGPKSVAVGCTAKLMKESNSLFPPVIETKQFTATINKSLVLKFALITYSDVPQLVFVTCADKSKSIKFAVLK